MTTENDIQWPCPVCGHDSFGEPPGCYFICPVCRWEDDSVQIRHPRMRGGANSGSIFDYQEQRAAWILPSDIVRDPLWRPMDVDEAALPSGEVGVVDYTLNYYGEGEPYYWRQNRNAEHVVVGNGG